MSRNALIVLTFLILALFGNNAFAQESSAPKVGLVLSGGGAKGFAHVGVLKILEKSGVHIDYISGTSMGAIIGGLYASGWSADQLDSILQVADFQEIMTDELPRDVLPFFEKEYGEKYALSLSVKDFKVKLPSAISNGQNALNFFSRLTRHVTHIHDFSELKIPFVCFGTDAETGEEVVFENGNLARAIRASGSFPGLLTPFEIDGRLITDGGIVNNFPARILKTKGMNFIIGVNVEDGLYKKEDLYEINKIIEQVSSFQMAQNSKSQLELCNILMYPNYKGFGLTSFEAADTLIRSGEIEAEKYWDELQSLAKRQQPPGERNILPPNSDLDSIDVEEVIIYHSNTLSRMNILEFFPNGLEGRISEKDFYKGIVNLYGTGAFRYVDFSFSKKENDKHELIIQCYEKKGFDRRLRVGLHYDNVYKSSLLLNFTLLNVGFDNSVFSGNLIIGDRFRYTANYLIDYGNRPDIGLNSRLEYNFIPIELPVRFPADSTFQSAKFDFGYTDFSNEIYLRLLSDNKQALGVSAEVKYFSATTDQLIDRRRNDFVGERGTYFTASVYHKYDSRNHRNFPERGFLSDFRFRYINPLISKVINKRVTEPSFNLDWSFLEVFPVTGNFSVGLKGDIGWSIGEQTPPYVYFLGGNNKNFINNFKPLEGLSFAEKFGNNLLRGTLYGQLRPGKNSYMKVSGNLVLLSEKIGGLLSQKAIQSFSVGGGYDTPLGPIELTYALSTEGSRWYFNLGYWF